MKGWLPIETAPRDGRPINYRRMIDGRIAFEGECCWGVRSAAAPARQPLTAYIPGSGLVTDPPSATVDTPAWMTLDGLYLVPAPTHWSPKS